MFSHQFERRVDGEFSGRVRDAILTLAALGWSVEQCVSGCVFVVTASKWFDDAAAASKELRRVL